MAVAQQIWTGLGPRLDLMTIDRCDEIGPCREVPVDGSDADPGASRDVTDGRIDARSDKGGGGRGKQARFVALCIGPFSRSGRSWCTVRHGPSPLKSGTLFRNVYIGTMFRLLNRRGGCMSARSEVRFGIATAPQQVSYDAAGPLLRRNRTRARFHHEV